MVYSPPAGESSVPLSIMAYLVSCAAVACALTVIGFSLAGRLPPGFARGVVHDLVPVVSVSLLVSMFAGMIEAGQALEALKYKIAVEARRQAAKKAQEARAREMLDADTRARERAKAQVAQILADRAARRARERVT